MSQIVTKFIADGVITNAKVNAAAGIVYSKLNLTGGIVNADVNATAAIVYSKLSLSNSIVNADINSAAAIVYSKLSLASSILASDMNSGAATNGQILTANGSGGATYTSPAAAASYGKETFVLSGTDITNQYVDLAQVAKTNSILFMVKGAGGLLEGASYDYSVSYTGGAGGNTRITFLNDLATGGAAALVATDVVQINYAY
jgi:hypothetical protein